MSTAARHSLFGMMAGLAMSMPAGASEFPAADPVEYVEVCSGEGAGFFYIPGATSCLRMAEQDPVTSSPGMSLNIDQKWGDVQLGFGLPGNGEEQRDRVGLPAGEPGWHVQSGLKFDVPGTGSGVQTWVQGNYAEGAAARTSGDLAFGSGVWNGTVIDPAVVAGKNVDDQVRQFGAGIDVRATDTMKFGMGAAFSSVEKAGESSDVLMLGSSIFWTPVENLDLGLSALYAERLSGTAVPAEDLSLKARIERDF